MRRHSLTIWTPALALLAGAAIATAAPPAVAQLDNRPFQFRNSGGMGMSTAGRQAILEQELFDRTPDNLVRRGGVLVDVVEGPGGEALVRSQARPFIPDARPSRNRGGAAAGVFNAFFTLGAGGGGTASYSPAAYRTTGAVTSWTAAVVSDGGYGGGGGGDRTSAVIGAWTQQVSLLGH
jgi:hypothetical protein